jgi:hypothetical protein
MNGGMYLSFDIVYNGYNKPIFKTFSNARGIDRSGKDSGIPKFIFSVEKGNLNYSTLAYDHNEEYNYIYAGGSGRDDSRIIAEAYNDTWIQKSPINRREDFIDARDNVSTNQVQADANARLQEAGPKEIVNGHIIQTKDSLYGLHYKYGDIVMANINGLSIPIHLDSVNVTVDGSGDEDIKIFTRNLDDSEY